MKLKQKREELANSSSEVLKVSLTEKQKEFFNLRVQHRIGQLNDTSTLRQVKRDIARIKTYINKEIS